MLAEFTRDDIAELVARGPTLRQPDPAAKTAATAYAGRLIADPAHPQ